MAQVTDNKSRRWRIFSALAPIYGKQVSADFIQKTAKHIPDIERIHNLIEGIYKPAWTDYALAISSMLTNPYADKLHETGDGSWWMHYSPKRKGGLGGAQNVGLMNCMKDHEPIIVLKQLSNKNSSSGVKYRVMGLALVQQFDPNTELFTLRGIDYQTLLNVCSDLPDEQILASALRTEIVTDFEPFAAKNRSIYLISTEKRDAAFRDVVLDEYSNTCAVTGAKFVSNQTVEAEAAHIISKTRQGSDDPRNGIALSRTVHWAFDKGIFTISDQYEVVVNPKARQISKNNFPLLDLHGKRIQLPDDEQFYPHKTALDWHREEVFEKFDR
jgi:hypothetical protein